MDKRTLGCGSWLLAAALGAVVALPATAGEIYGWRTDDGSYAYTDDAEAVPARYRDRAEAKRAAPLADYPRYTAENDEATDRYAERLAERLELLRQRRAARSEQTEEVAAAAVRGEGPPEYVNLRSGPADRPGVDVAVPTRIGADEEPLTIETVFVRLEGSNVIQRVQVTKRGDRIVAVSQPRARNWDINDPFDEAELLEALAERE